MRSSWLNLDTVSGRRWVAMLSGLGLVLATPPIPLGFIAWFAILPLLIALEKATSKREAWLLGFLTGLVFYAGTVYWIAWNTGTILVARVGSAAGSVALLAFTLGLFTLTHSIVVRAFGRAGHFWLPLTWVANETLWHHTEFAFPWPSLALTQGYYLPLIQLAAVGGTALISAWVAALNGILAAGRDRRSAGIVVIMMVAMAWGIGAIREQRIYRSTIFNPIARVAVVQGNIEAALKWKLGAQYSLDIYEPLTNGLANDPPDLAVWPETAAPVYVQQDPRWRRHFRTWVDSLGFSVTTGARYSDFLPDKRIPYNAAFLIRPNQGNDFDFYAKVHLVPFGERVPLQWIVPQLGNLNLGQAEFKPGPGTAVWELEGRYGTIKAAPQICYETIFPNLSLRAVRKDANLLLNLTNDGWFAGTGQLEQHLLLHRMRSVETGISLARSTNTGISAFVGPSGRILKSLPKDIRGVIVEDLPAPIDTPFNHWGWTLRYLMFIFDIGLVVYASALIWKRKKEA